MLFARVTNFPLLLFIHLVERHFLFRDDFKRTTSDEDDESDEDDQQNRPLWQQWLLPSFGYFSGKTTDLDAVFEHEDDIDDDSLPGGAFQINDGTQTPAQLDYAEANGGSGGRDKGKHDTSRDGIVSPPHGISAREQRRRFSMSMSDWIPGGGDGGSTLRAGRGGGAGNNYSTIRARPTVLSKLYGPGKRDTLRFLDTEQELLNERLDRIEEGQKRIEEALKGLGGGGE